MKRLFIIASVLALGTLWAWAQPSQISNSVGVCSYDNPANCVQPQSDGSVDVNIVSGGGSGGTSSNFGSSFPTAGTATGFSDGTNMREGLAVDGDSGAGTEYVQGVNLVARASGGSVEAGTATDPLRVDPTGTTAQPITDNAGSITVDGTITANAGTDLNTSTLAVESGGNLDTLAAGYATEGSALGSGVLLQGDDGTDRTNVLVDTDGNLQIDCVSGCSGSGGTSAVDDSAFTAATDSGTPMMGFVTTDDVNSGDVGVVGMTDDRAMHVNLRADDGTEISPALEAGNLATIAGDTTSLDGKDLMLGTDYTDVMGTTSLILGTQADDVVNTSDGQQVSAFGYAFDGTTWDRVRGTAADGLLVNLGANNDISGTVTANAGTNLNTSALALDTSVDGVEALLTTIDSDTGTISTNSGTIAAGYAAEGSALGSGVLLQGDDGTDRTNVAVDTSGNVQIDIVSDGAGLALDTSVDGVEALLTTIDADTSSLAGTVSGSEIQVDVLSFPDNEPINVAQMNGVAVTMGNGVAGTGVQRVAIASNNTVLPAVGADPTGTTVPANAVYMGANVGGNTTGLVTCNSSVAISTASSGNTELVSLTASQQVRVCGYNFIASGDVDVQLIYGTGTACATGETDLTGAYDLTTNSGIVVQSPFWTGMASAASNALCIELSGAVQVSGVLFYTKY